jgi:hypothetical protein
MVDPIQFLANPQFTGIFLIIKITFILISFLFLIGIILILKYSNWLRFRYFMDLAEVATYRPYGTKKVNKEWAKILARLETGNEDEYKLAIIEADSMLDEFLKRMGYAGETLGEKLKLLTASIIPSIDSLWEAHRIRSDIVHDPDYRISMEEARRVLAIYEQAFRHFQILD